MKARVTDSPLRVVLLGMNDRMQSAIRLFFKIQCGGLCVQSDDQSAEASLIDLDDAVSDDMLSSFRKARPGRPIIAISLRDVNLDGVIVLRKPLKPVEFRAALVSIHTRLRNDISAVPEPARVEAPAPEPRKTNVTPMPTAVERAAAAPLKAVAGARSAQGTHRAAMALSSDANTQVGTMRDINPDDSGALANIYYDPAKFFQGILQNALQLAKDKQRHVKLKTQISEFIVDPSATIVSTTLGSSNASRALCSLPLSEKQVEVTVLPNDGGSDAGLEWHRVSAESLLWDTALFSARGRIPVGVPLTTPIYLQHWPNMTRLTKFPNAMRVAALWARQPYSLMDTSEVLGIPQRYVFAFYSAASALGHAGVTRRSVDRLFQPPDIEKHEKRGLFSRILNRLGVGASESEF